MPCACSARSRRRPSRGRASCGLLVFGLLARRADQGAGLAEIGRRLLGARCRPRRPLARVRAPTRGLAAAPAAAREPGGSWRRTPPAVGPLIMAFVTAGAWPAAGPFAAAPPPGVFTVKTRGRRRCGAAVDRVERLASRAAPPSEEKKIKKTPIQISLQTLKSR